MLWSVSSEKKSNSGARTLHDAKGSSCVGKCGNLMAVVIFEHQPIFGPLCGLDLHWFGQGAGALDRKWLIVLIALGAFVLLPR
jgi:hypothetical protein